MPKDGYTDGDWQNARCTNGNKLGGQVLYWMPHPNKPDLRYLMLMQEQLTQVRIK